MTKEVDVMGKQKKILIVSASIGTGHMQAAKAIQEYYALTEPEAVVEHVDFLSQRTFSIDYVVKEFYIKLLDIFPMFYELLYRLTQRKHQGEVVQTIVSWMLKNRMLNLIKKENPDILVFTHPFPCGAACILKRQKLIDLPIVGVITDFAIHQFWVYPQVDRYCVGSDILIKNLKESGIDENKIIVTGMPIRRSYYNRPLRKYDFNTPIKALVMGGGLGLGSMEKVIKQLNNMPEISSVEVVTGHNETLYESLVDLGKNFDKPIKVYGYTTDIPHMMREASILFTKPGGLTCQEALALGLPMVFYSAIPGQEEENATLFEKMGCAYWVKDVEQLSKEVDFILNDYRILQKMSDASLHLQENGSANIGKVINYLLSSNLKEDVLNLKMHTSLIK